MSKPSGGGHPQRDSSIFDHVWQTACMMVFISKETEYFPIKNHTSNKILHKKIEAEVFLM